MSSLSHQFYLKKQQDAQNARNKALATNNELSTVAAGDSPTKNIETSEAVHHDPYFNATKAFKDASQKSLQSLRERTRSELDELAKSSNQSPSKKVTWDESTFIENMGRRHVDQYDHLRRQQGRQQAIANKREDEALVWGEFEEPTSSYKEFAEQTVDTCGYCSILASRVAHTRCYTAFYLTLFFLGAVAGVVAILAIVHNKKPEERSYLFFATYGTLLLLFFIDISIRLMASGCRRFCRRTFNTMDVFMFVVSISGLILDIVPFHDGDLDRSMMLSDTCVVVLVTLVIFTRVVVLGCQHVHTVNNVDQVIMNGTAEGSNLPSPDHYRNVPQYEPPTIKNMTLTQDYSNNNYYRSHTTSNRSLSSNDISIINNNRTQNTIKSTVVNLDTVASKNRKLKSGRSGILKNNNSSNNNNELVGSRASNNRRSKSFTYSNDNQRSLLGRTEPL